MYNIEACKMNILVINYSQKERYQSKGKTQTEKPKYKGKNLKKYPPKIGTTQKEKTQRMVKLNQIPKANRISRMSEAL